MPDDTTPDKMTTSDLLRSCGDHLLTVDESLNEVRVLLEHLRKRVEAQATAETVVLSLRDLRVIAWRPDATPMRIEGRPVVYLQFTHSARHELNVLFQFLDGLKR